jgi:hypothetical protein
LQAAQKQQALEAQLGQSAGQLAATGQGNLINAATVGGNLAGQTQALGLGDVNALATLGGQQQTIAQNQQLFPLQKLAQQAALMKGYTVPTTTVQTMQGSPLSAVIGLGATAAGLGQPTYTLDQNGKMVAGPSIGAGIYSGLSDIIKSGYNTVKDAFYDAINYNNNPCWHRYKLLYAASQLWSNKLYAKLYG